MAVPAATSLIDLRLVLQAGVRNPASGPLGLSLSQAFELSLGR